MPLDATPKPKRPEQPTFRALLESQMCRPVTDAELAEAEALLCDLAKNDPEIIARLTNAN